MSTLKGLDTWHEYFRKLSDLCAMQQFAMYLPNEGSFMVVVWQPQLWKAKEEKL